MACLFLPQAFGTELYEAPPGEGISVDGEVETAWNSVQESEITHYLQGSSCLAEDFSGSFRALWNAATGKLYLLVEVRDSQRVRDSGGSPWDDDNVELYLDGDLSRGSGSSGSDSGYDGLNDYQIRFIPGPASEMTISGAAYNGQLDYAFADWPEGYRLEIAVDLGAIGVTIDPLAPADIGFDLHLTDDDDGGGRDHKFAWSAMQDDSWFNPSSFGVLRLSRVPPGHVETIFRVGSAADLAEEGDEGEGIVELDSSDLELVEDHDGRPQTVGIRFPAIHLPEGATVTAAWIQFTTDEDKNRSPFSVSIAGEATDDATAFEATPFNLSSREPTTASVLWEGIPDWTVPGASGPEQRTPDLTGIVEEILNRPGWTMGNAICFLFSGAGTRTAVSAFENPVPGEAPELYVRYEGGETQRYTLTVEIEGPGEVVLFPERETYLPGETVEITAIPDSGFRFAGWSGALDSMQSSVSLRVGHSHLALGALFEPLPAGSTVFAMNCGGSAITNGSGVLFQANAFSNPRSSPSTDLRPIAGTEDDNLYHTRQSTWTKLIYAVPLPPGLYEVDLMWAAPSWENSDNRTVMDVSVNGRLVEDDLDVWTEAGGASAALIRSYPVVAAGGELRIVLFRSIAGEPYLNAFRIRSLEDSEVNRPPVLRIVNKPAVLGDPVAFGQDDFAASFFDPDGDPLASIRVEGLPLHGILKLGETAVAKGDVISADQLPRLRYESNRTERGRDFWQWRGSDGSLWAEEAGVVHLFLRAEFSAVRNLITATWNTFSWPLYAYYPEGDEGDFGVILGGDGKWRWSNACGPTARSHINYFWQYPRQPIGNLRFMDNNGQIHDPGFPHRTYRYDAMPPQVRETDPEELYQEVAKLMWDNDELAIDIWLNGANAWEPMIPYHGFDGAAHLINREEIGEAAWIEALKRELNMGRLVQVTGINASGGGHWWLISGYNAENQFYSRLNYGPEGFYPNGNFDGYAHDLTIMTDLQPRLLGQVLLYDPSGNPGTPLETAKQIEIRWSAPNARMVDLEYSFDNGLSWQTIATGLDSSIEGYSWTTPARESGQFRLRVTDSDNLNAYSQSRQLSLQSPPPLHPIQVLAAPHGQVVLEPAMETFPEGDWITATAIPDQGYRFTGWEGLSQSDETRLNFQVTGPGELRATFQSLLMEAFHDWAAGQDLRGTDAEPGADPDLDGMANLLEFLHPSGDPDSPSQPGSFLTIAQGNAFAEVRLRSGIPLTTLQLLVSEDLSEGSWEPVSECPFVEWNAGTGLVRFHQAGSSGALFLRFAPEP